MRFMSIAVLLMCVSAPTWAQAPVDADTAPAESGTPNYVPLVVIGILAASGAFVVWMLRKRSDAERAGDPAPPRPNIAPDRTSNPSAPLPATTSQGTSIFISYRREDSADISGRISDRLVERFGKTAVFKDVDSIPLGRDFRTHLQEAVGRCDALLAIIGRQWCDASVNGKRRLDDPRDHLRIELESALARNIPVIPVLVQGASMPGEEVLPESLRPLAYRHAILVRPDPDFNGDLDRLMRGMEAQFGTLSSL